MLSCSISSDTNGAIEMENCYCLIILLKCGDGLFKGVELKIFVLKDYWELQLEAGARSRDC